MAVVTFSYNDNTIEFDINDQNLMVNATQMAKVFDKDLFQFTKSEAAKTFISECLKPANAGFLNIKNEDDLFTSKQKTGTFMHRILALKFAAWLNPAFELWVYQRIDKIVFGEYEVLKKSLKNSAQRKVKIDTLREELRKENPTFAELEILELEERQAGYARGKFSRSQIDIFKEGSQPAESR